MLWYEHYELSFLSGDLHHIPEPSKPFLSNLTASEFDSKLQYVPCIQFWTHEEAVQNCRGKGITCTSRTRNVSVNEHSRWETLTRWRSLLLATTLEVLQALTTVGLGELHHHHPKCNKART